MSLGSIVVLAVIFGWIGYLIYKWAKKQKLKKEIIAAGGPPCGGGCSGCTAATNAVPGETFECPSMKGFNITIAEDGEAVEAGSGSKCCCNGIAGKKHVNEADQKLIDQLTNGSGSCCH